MGGVGGWVGVGVQGRLLNQRGLLFSFLPTSWVSILSKLK